jgi:hypothetical protein
MSSEQWRPVVGYAGVYEVSNLGRVCSTNRFSSNGRQWPSVVLKPTVHPNGHLQVHLSRNNVHRTYFVHALVLDAFVGPGPEGTECLHRDGVPANNTLSNLEWGSRSENVLDQVRHGVHFYASRTHCPQGHPYDDENTYLNPAGNHRKCRQCMRAQALRTTERRRAQRKAAA